MIKLLFRNVFKRLPEEHVRETAEDAQEREIVEKKQDTDRDSSFLYDFLKNALIEKYDTTTALLEKLVWPFFFLCISFFFYDEISNIIRQLSTSLDRTSKITIAGIEVEVHADLLRGSDIKAFSIIEELARDDLISILETGEAPIQISLANFSEEYYKDELKKLEDLGLIKIDRQATSVIDANETVVRIELTDIGVRVYRELQSILINFLIDFSEEE